MKRILVLLCLLPFLSFAQVGVAKTKLSSLVVYSNNFAYIVREGEGQLENGFLSIDCLPQATAGSLWLYIKQKGAYPDTIANPKENTIDFKDKSQLLASLQGKIGEKLRIETESGASEGKLTHVLPDLILLQGDKQVFAIKPEEVKKVVLLEYPLKMKVGGVKGDEKVSFTLSYLQGGMGWEPYYLLYISNDKEAMLSLRATLVNNLEDLDNITCYFAVGMPQFPWRFIIDPLITRSLMIPTDGGVRLMTAPAAPVMMEKAAAEGAGYAPPPVSLGGEELSALFLYKKENFTLKKGDAGAVTLFNSPVPYKHLYAWNVDEGRITHNISFINKTDVPLVPGSILVVEGGNPLGQDRIALTPAGAEGKATLGVAGELQGKSEETEISREVVQMKDKEGKVYTGTRARVRGRLELTNFGKKEIEAEVTKTLQGTVLSTTPQAEVTLISSRGLNPLNKITWKVKVPGGGKMEMKYEYTTLQMPPGTPPILPAEGTQELILQEEGK